MVHVIPSGRRCHAHAADTTAVAAAGNVLW